MEWSHCFIMMKGKHSEASKVILMYSTYFFSSFFSLFSRTLRQQNIKNWALDFLFYSLGLGVPAVLICAARLHSADHLKTTWALSEKVHINTSNTINLFLWSSNALPVSRFGQKCLPSECKVMNFEIKRYLGGDPLEAPFKDPWRATYRAFCTSWAATYIENIYFLSWATLAALPSRLLTNPASFRSLDNHDSSKTW